MFEASLEELITWLQRVPVLATVHPLVPLCLPPDVQVTSDIQEIQALIDKPSHQMVRPILILSDEACLKTRFPHLFVPFLPSAETINQGLSENLAYAKSYLLTTNDIAEYIEKDVSANQFETIVVFFVDGLSYADVVNWPYELQPCFVDGPSVTFRFQDENRKQLTRTIGFPAIVGRPSIYTRLYRQGYRNARGYTYWNRDNVIADYMFTGIPHQRVSNFEAVLELLATEDDLHHSYVQIMREGLDGLAHSKRELRRQEVDASILGILRDVERLAELLQEKGRHGCIYLTADHGILWKTEHPFRIVPDTNTRHPRYWVGQSQNYASKEFTVPFDHDGTVYHLYKYPFLGTAIKANDSGVHGGLSYQESIVPFAKFEVKPKWN
jgi:hypothetical protein